MLDPCKVVAATLLSTLIAADTLLSGCYSSASTSSAILLWYSRLPRLSISTPPCMRTNSTRVVRHLLVVVSPHSLYGR